MASAASDATYARYSDVAPAFESSDVAPTFRSADIEPVATRIPASAQPSPVTRARRLAGRPHASSPTVIDIGREVRSLSRGREDPVHAGDRLVDLRRRLEPHHHRVDAPTGEHELHRALAILGGREIAVADELHPDDPASLGVHGLD